MKNLNTERNSAHFDSHGYKTTENKLDEFMNCICEGFRFRLKYI